MSLTGSSARRLVVRRKIHAEPPILPALPATAYSFVVTKKIVLPPSGSLDQTALSTSQTPVPMTSGLAPAKIPPLPSVSLSFNGQWQKSALISRLMNEADASPSLASASAPITDAASASADPAREAAFMSAVLERVTVSPQLAPASKRTVNTELPSGNHLPEREAPTPMTASKPITLSKQTPSLPYSLQLSSCRSLENARNAAADFSQEGSGPIHRECLSQKSRWLLVACFIRPIFICGRGIASQE